MRVDEQLLKFRMQLMRVKPFYGDLLMQLIFEENRNIPTAATDGKKVMYNPDYMGRLPEGARNFIWMHELMHVILLHAFRIGNRDPKLWNVAGDLIINNMLADNSVMSSMRDSGIPFQRPADGLFAALLGNITVEELYELLSSNNTQNPKKPLF